VIIAGDHPGQRPGIHKFGRDLEAVDGDERSISDLLVDQVEFADVLVLNKTDLVRLDGLGTVETLLRRLNPSAQLLRADHGVVDLSEVLDTGRYNPVTAAQAPGWAAELAGSHTPETEQYGISSVVYRAARPFHPERLAAAVDG
jgi:G3E family GTPase